MRGRQERFQRRPGVVEYGVVPFRCCNSLVPPRLICANAAGVGWKDLDVGACCFCSAEGLRRYREPDLRKRHHCFFSRQDNSWRDQVILGLDGL